MAPLNTLDDRGETTVPEWAKRQQGGRTSNAVSLQTLVQNPTRMLCIGGGTGLPTVLKGLAPRAAPKPGDPGLDLTAVVAMSDDGGSSGRLRRARGLLPPGDIRNCLVAMADGKSPLTEVFNYRFGGAKGLAGHAVGNLLIAALAELKGNFLEAVQSTGSMLGSRGTVLPCTLQSVELAAELEDGSYVVGERNIVRSGKRVKRVSLLPNRPPPVVGLLDAIREADLITIGPGSLYSSIMPNLLVEGVAEALRAARAMKVMVANLMTQPGETDGLGCEDHVRAVLDHVGPVIDVVLLNSTPPAEAALTRYAQRGSMPVVAQSRELLELGVIPISADLLKSGPRVRHDSSKLARRLIKLARTGL